MHHLFRCFSFSAMWCQLVLLCGHMVQCPPEYCIILGMLFLYNFCNNKVDFVYILDCYILVMICLIQ